LKIVAQISVLLVCGIICGCATTKRDYKAPKVLFEGELEYPLSAQLNKVEGDVLVGVFVDKEGKPLEANILRSSGSEDLDSAAVSFSRKVAYEPAVYNENPIGSWTRLELRYKLQKIDFDENSWLSEVRHIQKQLEAEPDAEKRKVLLQRLYTKYSGMVEFVKKNDDVKINKIIALALTDSSAKKWQEFYDAIPVPFVLYDDFWERYPECPFKIILKDDLMKQIIEAQYMLRMKSFKNPRFMPRSLKYLDILSARLDELQML
jgi:TonB family protein